jgi:hypothetical protein
MWQAPQSESQSVMDQKAGRPDHSGRILYGHINPYFYGYHGRVGEEICPWNFISGTGSPKGSFGGNIKNRLKRSKIDTKGWIQFVPK